MCIRDRVSDTLLHRVDGSLKRAPAFTLFLHDLLFQFLLGLVHQLLLLTSVTLVDVVHLYAKSVLLVKGSLGENIIIVAILLVIILRVGGA